MSRAGRKTKRRRSSATAPTMTAGDFVVAYFKAKFGVATTQRKEI